jgi:hypothetical protein
MGHWLAWAYALEFGGRRVPRGVGAASLLFYAAHVWVLVELVLALAPQGKAPQRDALQQPKQSGAGLGSCPKT